MGTFTLKVDDIDEFICGASHADWQSEYVQLSPGRLKFQTRVVELPGISLFWNHFETRMRINEAYLGNTLIFGFILKTEKPFLYRGHEFPMDHAVIQHCGAEHYYFVPENIDSLIIHVDRALIADAGLHISNTVEMPVPGHALDALANECRSATRIVQQLSASGDNEQVEKMLRNRILLRLQQALAPWSMKADKDSPVEPQPGRDYLLFRKAENMMSDIGLGTRPSISELADKLGVSKRSLFYAFNKWVGMGPKAYFEVMRLHYVRDRLLAENSSTTRVTDVANEVGFNHLGRFSGRYFQFFGEYPSETLDHARD